MLRNLKTSALQVNGLREVQALRRMAPHPNIVRLLEVLLCAARSLLHEILANILTHGLDSIDLS